MIHVLLSIFFHQYEKAKARRQLKWQETLFRHGVGFRTRLLDVVEKSRPINDYVLVSIRAKLRVGGKIVCRRLLTLSKDGHVPIAGDIVRIRYSPRQMYQVLLVEGSYQN